MKGRCTAQEENLMIPTKLSLTNNSRPMCNIGLLSYKIISKFTSEKNVNSVKVYIRIR